MCPFRRRPFLGLVALHHLLQSLQRRGPQLCQHLAYRVEPVRIKGVKAADTVAPLSEQTRLGQHLQVMTDRLLRRVEVRRDLARRELAGPHQPEDAPAVRVGERAEDGVSWVVLDPGRLRFGGIHAQWSQATPSDMRAARASRLATSAGEPFG